MRIPGLLTALSLMGLGWASPAASETWPICFENGTILTPEAYAAFRDGAALFRSAGRFRASVTIRHPAADDGPSDKLNERRIFESYLEGLRAGISPGYLRTEATLRQPGDPNCFMLEVKVTSPPAMPSPPMLWHLRGVYFAPGSIEIGEAGENAIRVAAALNEPGRSRYLLDGHTDTQGTAEMNLDLSRRRTVAVAERLAREGVRWEDIEMTYHGETRLARASADGVSEALNRRVWIDVRYRPATSD